MQLSLETVNTFLFPFKEAILGRKLGLQKVVPVENLEEYLYVLKTYKMVTRRAIWVQEVCSTKSFLRLS